MNEKRPARWERRSGAYSELIDHLYTPCMHISIKFDGDDPKRQRHLINAKLTGKYRSEFESHMDIVKTAYVTDDHDDARKNALDRVDAYLGLLKQEIRHALVQTITRKD